MFEISTFFPFPLSTKHKRFSLFTHPFFKESSSILRIASVMLSFISCTVFWRSQYTIPFRYPHKNSHNALNLRWKGRPQNWTGTPRQMVEELCSKYGLNVFLWWGGAPSCWKRLSPGIFEVLEIHSSEAYFYSSFLSHFAFRRKMVPLVVFVTGCTNLCKMGSSAKLDILLADALYLIFDRFNCS